MKPQSLLVPALVAAIALLVMTDPAMAYLDPGSGSYFFQLLLGAVLGCSFALKIYWRNLVSFGRRLFSKSRANRPSEQQDGPE
jgi:hypothetical protein